MNTATCHELNNRTARRWKMADCSPFAEGVFRKLERLGNQLLALAAPALGVLLALASTGTYAAARPDTITVAVTNPAYASIAKAVGGSLVRTVRWQTGSKGVRYCPSDARIVIDGSGTNGPSRARIRRLCHSASLVILARDFVGKNSTVHRAFWYSPAVVPRLSNVLAAEFIRLEPRRKVSFIHNLGAFMRKLQPAYALWAEITDKTRHWTVATEGGAANTLALALHMHVASSPRDAGTRITSGKLNAVIYDTGIGGEVRSAMSAEAHKRGIPAVAIEAHPTDGAAYPRWLRRQLARVLAGTRRGKQ